jgi:thioredoxin-related protein
VTLKIQQAIAIFAEQQQALGTLMTYKNQNAAIHLSRRTLLAGAGASLLPGAFPAIAAHRLGLDGIYEEPWTLKTSGDLGKDFAETARAKKTFAIAWELRGCPWCKRLHLENYARDDIASYMRENFGLVQLNIQAARGIKDFDGEMLPEEALSYKYGIRSTPTIQFFKPSDASKGREVGRIGYADPDEFLRVLRFVRERGYERGSFEDWIRTHKNPA